jgi:hypothetical protein
MERCTQDTHLVPEKNFLRVDKRFMKVPYAYGQVHQRFIKVHTLGHYEKS